MGEGYCVKVDTTTSNSHRGDFEGEHHLTSSYTVLPCVIIDSLGLQDVQCQVSQPPRLLHLARLALVQLGISWYKLGTSLVQDGTSIYRSMQMRNTTHTHASKDSDKFNILRFVLCIFVLCTGPSWAGKTRNAFEKRWTKGRGTGVISSRR